MKSQKAISPGEMQGFRFDLPEGLVDMVARAIAAQIKAMSEDGQIAKGRPEPQGAYPNPKPGVSEEGLPQSGFLRLPDVLRLIPVSKSAWYEGVRNGTYPKPRRFGARIVAWDVREIRRLLGMSD